MSVVFAVFGGRARAFVLGVVLAISFALVAGAGIARAAAPVANDVFAGTNDVSPVAVHFDASDDDLDPIEYSIVDQPAGGSLGAIDQGAGTVVYTAAADFAGIDTFTYRATAAGEDSGVAVATVTVRPDTSVGGASGLTSDNTPTFTFGSPQSGTIFECRIDGGSWSACASPLTADELADGSHTFDVRARAGAGGPFDASPASATVIVDTTAPTPVLQRASAQDDPTNDAAIAFELAADEDLDPATVTTDDFEVTNGSLDAVSGSGSTISIDVTAAGEGAVEIAPSAEYSVADLVGNETDDAGDGDRSVVYDVTAPEFTLEQAADQADPAKDAPVQFTFAANEALEFGSIDASDFDVVNGSVDSIVADGSDAVTISIAPATEDVVSIEPSSTFEASDAAGNTNDQVQPGEDRSVAYDATAPTVTLEQASGQADPAVDPEIEFTLSADEDLDPDTVTADDFVLTNATLDSVSGSGDAYTVAVTADGEGLVEIDASPEFEVADPAGNATASAGGSDRDVTYDRSPEVTLGQAEGQADPTNVAAIEFALSANEDLDSNTVDASDFDVANGTIDSVTGSGAEYVIAVTATAEDAVTISESGTFSVSDLTGNPVTAAGGDDRSVTYDVTPPVAEIQTSPADPSLDPTPTFVFDSNEAGSTFECQLWKDGDAAPGFTACESPLTSDLLEAGHEYHFEVRAIDPATNVGAPDSYSWQIDPNGISAGAETDPYFTRGGEPVMISVIANDTEAGDLAFTQVPGGDGTVGSFTVDGDKGSALFTANDGFAGFGAVTIRVENTTTGASTDVQVNVVVRPQTRLLTGPGVGLTPGLTNTPFPTFTFDAVSGPSDGVVPGVAFSCKLDGLNLPDASCAGGTFTPNTPLTDGDHTFEVRAKKPGSNIDEVAQVASFTIDTVLPGDPELDGPEGLTKVNDLTYTFTIPEGTAECRLDDGSDLPYAPCSSPVELTDVPDGSYTFQVRTVDEAGNRSAAVGKEITVDTVVNPAFDQVPVDGNRDGRPVIEVSTDEDPGVDYSYRLYLAGTPAEELPEFESTDPTFTLPLLDKVARYVLEVKAVDQAGNEKTISAEWDQENTAPVAPAPSYTFEAGTTQEIDLGSTDADDDQLTYTAGDVHGGTLGPIGDDGKAEFVVDDDAVGSYGFEFEVTDGREGGTVDSTVDITVLPTTVFTDGPGATTKNVRPTWTFESPAESVVNFECRLDAVGDDGAWFACDEGEYTPTSDLAPGDHTFEVRAVAGALVDPTPALSEFTVDLDAPEVDIDTQPDLLSNESAPAFTFSSVDPTATFECAIDEGDWVACESGQPLAELSDGQHKFEVRAVDPAGNVGPAKDYTWEVDATNPVIEFTEGPGADDWTNARRPVWEFEESDLNLDPAATTCQVDAQPVENDCLSPWQPATNLTDGQHTVVFTASDNAGNTETVSWTFRVTTITPTVVINDGPANPSGPTAEFEFSSSTDLGANGGFECRVSLNGGSYSAWEACDANLTLENLTSGNRTLQVRAVDSGGNRSVGAAVASWSWTTIGGTPDTAITGQTLNGGNAAFAFNSPGNAVATFECRIDGGNWSACTSPKSFSGLAAGEHTFEVRAVNQVGSKDGSPAEHVWNVTAATPPETTIDRRPSATTTATSAAFEFSSSEAVSTFECRIDGGAWEACASPKEYTGLSVGDHAFEVRAKSGALVDGSPAKAEWKVIAQNVDPGDPQICNPIAAKVSRSKNVKLGKGLKVRVRLSHRQAIAGQAVTVKLLVNGKAPKGKLKRKLKKALKGVDLVSQGAVVAQLKANKWTAKFEAGDDTPKNLRVLLKRKKGKALRTTAAFTLRACDGQ